MALKHGILTLFLRLSSNCFAYHWAYPYDMETIVQNVTAEYGQ